MTQYHRIQYQQPWSEMLKCIRRSISFRIILNYFAKTKHSLTHRYFIIPPMSFMLSFRCQQHSTTIIRMLFTSVV